MIKCLKNTALPNDSSSNFTEDMLLHEASFICDQVISFDERPDPYEHLLIVAPCMRRLIDLAGITFEKINIKQQVIYLSRISI